jgi:hypothetical protein
VKLVISALAVLMLISQLNLASAQSSDIEIYVIGFDIAKGSPEEASLKDFSEKMGGNYLSAEDATTSQALESALTSSYTGNLNQTTSSNAFMQRLAGEWVMRGASTGVQNSDWVAALTLNLDGTLSWRETEGATPGAMRTGTWDYDGTTVILKWVAPKGGQTAWVSTSVNDSSIAEGAYTAENAPSGVWSAVRSISNSQRSGLQGDWRMEGRTTGTANSDWVATLTINSDGTLSWRETEGATVGASRTGTWDYDGATITLRWTTPNGGQTVWTSSSVNDRDISNGAYSAENSKGGTWSASRLSSMSA